jgi:dihydroneopterin aldolase
MARNHTPDQIEIRNLEVTTHIGVPEEERREPQRLSVTLILEPNRSFEGLEDRIENTVDYAAVCEAVKKVAATRPRQLVETLAEEVASHLLNRFPIWRISVEIRKFILPETEYVAVRIERPVP